jgi:hypothetical protein
MKPILHSFFAGALLSILLVCGCTQRSQNPLCGDWEIASADSLLRRLGQSIENDAPEAENQPPKMLLQFHPDGTLKTTTRMGSFDPPPKEGTWKQLTFDAANNVMTIECRIGTQVTDHEVSFLEEDLIELVPPNMAGTNSKIKFTRRK